MFQMSSWSNRKKKSPFCFFSRNLWKVTLKSDPAPFKKKIQVDLQ